LTPAMAKIPTVDEWLAGFAHPLVAELEALRSILNSIDGVAERIKWNAPSYHHDGVDVATFMVRYDEELLLIVHHPLAPTIESPLLEGDFEDGRRIVHFRSMDDVVAGEDELRRVFGILLS
jgi:hypothetical protein